MKLISVNVGLPRDVEWNGQLISTAIFKEPVSGPIRLQALNLEGDQQADLEVHGGARKVVHAYPVEHYSFWREELGKTELPWGTFGENFTIEGVDEASVHVGDVLGLGSATLVVTEPRQSCYKLGLRLGRADAVKVFEQSGRSGFYLAVEKPGVVEAGDRFTIVREDPQRLTISDVVRAYTTGASDVELLQRVVDNESLDELWREHFRDELRKLLH